MSKRDRKNGVPATVTSIPLMDPHAMPENPSIGDLVKDATTQMSTLVRAEAELAKAEITRDVKKGLTGSVYFILALVVLLYSTFFMFFFLAELLDTWLWRWAAFLIVFLLMLLTTAAFALLGYRKVRRIRGPQQTIESVKETTAALTPGLAKFGGSTPGAAEPSDHGRSISRSTAPEPITSTSRAESSSRSTSFEDRRATGRAASSASDASETSATHRSTVARPTTTHTPVDSPRARHGDTPRPSARSNDPAAAVWADSGLPTSASDTQPGDSPSW